jgi:hypothetical protein
MKAASEQLVKIRAKSELRDGRNYYWKRLGSGRGWSCPTEGTACGHCFH